MAKVAIFMGSVSDRDVMAECGKILDKLDVPYFMTVTSAHRTLERTARLVSELEADGCRVFICGAGMAAHLAGAVAAKTTRPVLGVPLAASSLGGMDALLATVQMPAGFPVGTLALDKAGARNAAWLAAQILALSDPDLSGRIEAERAAMRESVEKAAAEMEKRQ